MMTWGETIRRGRLSRREEMAFNGTNRRARKLPLSNSNTVG